MASIERCFTKVNRGRGIYLICLVNSIFKWHQKIPRNWKNSHDTEGRKSDHHLSDIISSGPQGEEEEEEVLRMDREKDTY